MDSFKRILSVLVLATLIAGIPKINYQQEKNVCSVCSEITGDSQSRNVTND